MKIVSNNKLIRRNKKIGNFTTIGSLVILGLGLYISFTTQSCRCVHLVSGLPADWLLALPGWHILWQPLGPLPSPGRAAQSSLKGLDDKYTLYHYMTKVSHLLVGPAGIWVLLPFQQQGTITYNPQKMRWNQKGGNFYMKLFGQEGLGRPDQEANSALNDFKGFLKKEVEIQGSAGA